MAEDTQQMILTAAIMHGVGMHLGAWMAREGNVSDYIHPKMYLDIARKAEAGKLHSLFLADGITNAEEGTDRPCGYFDTVTLLTLMAAVTERIGLSGTASTTYNQPYDVARRFGTLDHLSQGRSGWNAIASFLPSAAAQFGGRDLPSHSDRYTRGDEFIEVVLKLWDSWKEGALIGDKENGVFADPELVREINHVGEFFQVRGPLPFPRSPQGRPVVIQAGSSEEGRTQAAKYADVIFTSQHLMEPAIEFRTDMRRRAAANGRNPDSLKVLPGVSLILGKTEEAAKERANKLEEVLGTKPQLVKLARRVGVPADALQLDEPFPVHLLGPDEEFSGSIGFRRSIVNLAVEKNMTVRQLIVHYGGGHQLLVGTAEQTANMMQTWLRAGAADGFNIMVDMLPSGIDHVVDLLVPELQKRKMFHQDYGYTTLSENLGLHGFKVAAAA